MGDNIGNIGNPKYIGRDDEVVFDAYFDDGGNIDNAECIDGILAMQSVLVLLRWR